MVSIHRVPVNVLLIISVVYFIFRFKCGVLRLILARLLHDKISFMSTSWGSEGR